MITPPMHRLEFFLNGEARQLDLHEADLSVLRYLRAHEHLSGTKEGCASGDCGACTVLIGRYEDAQWTYHSINSCITFMRQIAGCNIVTIEALARDSMHPAQTAMVECHGSQCGFCTPGFVMSMASLHKQLGDKPATLAQIQEALSGNLCRCTGYRPIIDAAKAMHSHDYHYTVQVWEPEAPCATEHSPFNPQSEKELAEFLSEHGDANIVAGATDLSLECTQRQRSLDMLVSISKIESLKQIKEAPEYLQIGSAVTYTEAHDALSRYFPEFANLLHRLGSQQVRNAGTIGGNIANASPIGDTPPVLIALGAEIELVSTAGSRWLLLEDFYLAYKQTQLKQGEFIARIRIPTLKANEHLKVYKLSKRLDDDISAVLMALKVCLDDNKIISCRSGFGGMAAIPKRAQHLEQALSHCEVSETAFAKAAEQLSLDFQPMTDVRASSDYRLQASIGLVRKCAIELLHPGKVTRMEQLAVSLADPAQLIMEGQA